MQAEQNEQTGSTKKPGDPGDPPVGVASGLSAALRFIQLPGLWEAPQVISGQLAPEEQYEPWETAC